MLKLGVITDEISQDFDYALKVAEELEIEYIELQSMWGKEVTELSNEEIKKVKNIIDKYKKKVCSISPHLFFRVPLRADDDYKSYWGSFNEHYELFKNAVRVAKELDCGLVRFFGLESDIWYGKGAEQSYTIGGEWGNVYDLIIKKFEKAITLAEKENITIIIETCFLNNLSSASALRKFIEKCGSNNVRALWDPCNTTYLCENPYPEGYNAIKDYLAHVHIKDGIVDLPNYSFEFCPPGEGNVRVWPQILNALNADKFDGIVSLEAEFLPEGGEKEDGLRLCAESAKKLLSNIK